MVSRRVGLKPLVDWNNYCLGEAIFRCTIFWRETQIIPCIGDKNYPFFFLRFCYIERLHSNVTWFIFRSVFMVTADTNQNNWLFVTF